VRHLRKTLHVACRLCGRVRRVGVRSPAAAAWSYVVRKDSTRAYWVEMTLRCRSCKLLLSIEQHRAAIRELEAKLDERRSRGL
jgi:hypothetical protein